MAKKQSSTEKKAKPAAKTAAKTLFSEPTAEPKLTKAAPKKRTTPSAAPARAITVEEIGLAAGEVWGALSTDNGGVTLAALKKSVAAPADLVLLALGWLAREDKVAIDVSGRTPTISLK